SQWPVRVLICQDRNLTRLQIGSRDPSAAFAGYQAALPIKHQAIGLVTLLPKDGQRSLLRVPLENPLRRNVAEKDVTPAVYGRSLKECHGRLDADFSADKVPVATKTRITSRRQRIHRHGPFFASL